MKSYKPDQGRMVRMACFWGLVMLLLFGCNFLHLQLSSYVDALEDPLGGLVIPIVSIPLSGAFLISALVFLGGSLWIYLWQQKPKSADFLIEVEGELRKVTWPTMQDVVNSSIVVIICVVILMGFLAGSDWFLGRLVTRLIYGWGGA